MRALSFFSELQVSIIFGVAFVSPEGDRSKSRANGIPVLGGEKAYPSGTSDNLTPRDGGPHASPFIACHEKGRGGFDSVRAACAVPEPRKSRRARTKPQSHEGLKPNPRHPFVASWLRARISVRRTFCPWVRKWLLDLCLGLWRVCLHLWLGAGVNCGASSSPCSRAT
jgi:hypothetical protein